MHKYWPSKTKKQRSYTWGKVAEHLCIWVLRLKGYRILDHSFRGPGGEIDIIASRFKTLIFIEVKARDDLQTAMLSISDYQKRRIEKTAHLYLLRMYKWQVESIRFDVMLVRPWRWPYHMVSAWRPEGVNYF